MIRKLVVCLFGIGLLSACGTFVPVLDVSEVPPEMRAQALNISIFTLGGAARRPTATNVIGPVEAYSCKHMMTDPPASRANALEQLRIKALGMGADAIFDVTFDKSGTDVLGTNCWEAVYAAGLAVATN